MIDTDTPEGWLLAPDTEPVAYAPLRDPHLVPVGDRPAPSSGSMETLSGAALSSWCDDEVAVSRTGRKVQLQLAPDCPVVIGRLEDGLPPYLDPAYRSTRVVPGTGQPVVRSADEGKDVCVSRAHFMLRGCAGGIVLTNGVPHVDGGIRPPTNGTGLLEPTRRIMEPAEEYLIEHGAAVVLYLPNRTTVKICAE
jgi:hypothetical protein